MIDSVDLRLSRYDAPETDFLGETSKYFQFLTEQQNSLGEYKIFGTLGGLKVVASKESVYVGKGSLCKWALGDNFQTLDRLTTQRALECLADTLHLPIDRAAVTRLDVGQNFLLKYPVEVYFNHLGEFGRAKRLPQPTGLYYQITTGQLVFYDKVKEQRQKRCAIPELYQGKNVLRYEIRYKHSVPKAFSSSEVTAASLYNERFYWDAVSRWCKAYEEIKKINDVTINFQAMTTKKDLYRMGLVALVEHVGGVGAFLEQLNEAQRAGTLTAKQKYDLREAALSATSVEAPGILTDNTIIQELTGKVEQVKRCCR